jgi:hypothetical protein
MKLPHRRVAKPSVPTVGRSAVGTRSQPSGRPDGWLRPDASGLPPLPACGNAEFT